MAQVLTGPALALENIYKDATEENLVSASAIGHEIIHTSSKGE